MPSDREQDSPTTWDALDKDLQRLVMIEKALRFFATAYFVEIAGLLNADIVMRLDRITMELGCPWQKNVEEQNDVTASFARDMYAVLVEQYLPHEAIAFILRGLGYAFPEPLLEEILAGEVSTDKIFEQSSCLRIRRDRPRRFDVQSPVSKPKQ